MREIGLGKELGDSPQPNVVKFIGCVTTQGKEPVLYILHAFYSRSASIFLCFLFVLVVYLIGKKNTSKEYFR